jgi:hypothetical protein
MYKNMMIGAKAACSLKYAVKCHGTAFSVALTL